MSKKTEIKGVFRFNQGDSTSPHIIKLQLDEHTAADLLRQMASQIQDMANDEDSMCLDLNVMGELTRCAGEDPGKSIRVE